MTPVVESAERVVRAEWRRQRTHNTVRTVLVMAAALTLVAIWMTVLAYAINELAGAFQ